MSTPAAARELLVSRLNRGLKVLADRDDLTVSVKWDAAPTEPPAWFDMTAREVTLNGPVALAGADPAAINPTTPAGRRRHPVLVGLLCHEASHAHSTRWGDGLGEHVSIPVAQAAELLEEPRIERRQLQRRPGDRMYLRAASAHILLHAPNGPSTAAAARWQAALAAVLTAGRVDAGVLDSSEVRTVAARSRALLGRGDYARLRSVWRAALNLEDGDVAGLLELATTWVEILGVDDAADVGGTRCLWVPETSSDETDATDHTEDVEKATDEAEDRPEEQPHPQADDQAAPSALEAAFLAAMAQIAAEGAGQAETELAEDSVSTEFTDRHERAARERAEEAAEHQAAELQAQQVFHRVGSSGPGDPRSGTRAPTDGERALARRLATALRQARFRGQGRIVTSSEVPPGRLVGRDAMLAAAQRTRGAVVTARPFRQVSRRESPEPTLVVGLAVDVSGSMHWATGPVASIAWVLANAVAQIGGTCATVAFGEQVTAITAPGVVPASVQEFAAEDCHEEFTAAMRALDGGLHLSAGEAARLVFVVSDGWFEDDEQRRSAKVVARLVRRGVTVLWVDLNASGDNPDTNVPAGAVPLPVSDLDELPHQIRGVLVGALRVS